MNKDQILLQTAYNEILEENWKNKLIGAGLGAAALIGGAEGLSHHIVNSDKNEKRSIQSTGVGVGINQDFENIGKLKSLIQNYYNLSGKRVNVTIQGDTVTLSSDKATKNIPLSTLKIAVETSKANGDTQKLSGYLAQNM
jgi:hypothetical protein